jgi:hypothetical protein
MVVFNEQIIGIMIIFVTLNKKVIIFGLQLFQFYLVLYLTI